MHIQSYTKIPNLANKMKKKITENEIPFQKLEKVGLTRQMIEDLPEDSLKTVLGGGLSPVLPIILNTPDGQQLSGRGRFSFFEKEDGDISVRIHPALPPISETIMVTVKNADGGTELKEIPAKERFKDDKLELLMKGKPILDLMFSPEGSSRPAYIQFDPDTNQFISVDKEALERNLKIVAKELKLTGSEDTCLKNGSVVTYSNTDDETVSVGIDLNSPTGVRFGLGDEKKWNEDKKRDWDKYELGLNGCWMTDDDGNLQYIPEEEFNDYDIWNEIEKQHGRKAQVDAVHRSSPGIK